MEHDAGEWYDEVDTDEEEFFDDEDEDESFDEQWTDGSYWSEDDEELGMLFSEEYTSREANAEYWDALSRADWGNGCTFDAQQQGNPDAPIEEATTYTLVDTASADTLTEMRSGSTHHQTQDAICVPSAPGAAAVMAVMSPSEILLLREGNAEAAAHTALGVDTSNSEHARLPAFARLQRAHTIPSQRATYSGAFAADGRIYAHCGGNPGLYLWGVNPPAEAQPSATEAELNMQRCVPVYLPCHRSPDPTSIQELFHEHLSTMLNCVRFGTVAGQERIIVAGQDGYIRILETPRAALRTPPLPSAAPNDGISVFEEMVCRSLRAGSNPCLDFIKNGADVTHTTRTVVRIGSYLRDVGAVDVPERDRGRTVALGPLPTPVNCADVSPDGRWMAVVGDCLQVLLLPEALDYCHFAAKALDMSCEDVASASFSEGCQYVAWSPNGEYLAVSSDSHRSVAVWRVSVPDESAMTPAAIHADLRKACEVKQKRSRRDKKGRRAAPAADAEAELDQALLAHLTGAGAEWPTAFGTASASASERSPAEKRMAAWRAVSEAFWRRVDITPVALFYNHPEPCLAVCWHPRAHSILFYTQAHALLTAVDLQCPCGSRQDVTLADLPDRAHRERINGLCVLGDRVVVAKEQSMVSLPAVVGWSKAAHRLWPQRFKDAVRVLLLNDCFGAARREARALAAGGELRDLELSNLPPGVIEHIIAFAAEPRSAWCEPRSVGQEAPIYL